MKIKLCILCFLWFVLHSASHAIDNNDRKNVTILAGLATNVFATYHKEKFKNCDKVWGVGYQYGTDKKLREDSVRLSFLDCEMETQDLLPWDVQFNVIPTVFGSSWQTSNGKYGDSLYEIGIVPVGRFSKSLGPVVLDAGFGLGLDYLSRNKIGIHQKSTQFQFSDEMDIGISDPKKRMRLSLIYRHISNLDIKLPNNGTNFMGLNFSYTFKP